MDGESLVCRRIGDRQKIPLAVTLIFFRNSKVQSLTVPKKRNENNNLPANKGGLLNR